MEILITNDDGYRSPGIKAAVELMRRFGNVTVLAPEGPRSGMSASITLEGKVFMEKVSETEGLRIFSCSGTPVDCVKLAMCTLFRDRRPDLLVSGINHGSNASIASLYSGTLGAAFEGALYGVHSIGLSHISHDTGKDLTGACMYAEKILKEYLNAPPSPETILNINFPDCPAGMIKGIRFANQGKGHWTDEFTESEDEDGRKCHVMEGTFTDSGCTPEELADADHILAGEGYVTIVPMTFDRTDRTEKARLEKAWNL